VKLPRPEFIVLYNGASAYPDRRTLKLSEAFEKVEGNDSVNLELAVKVFNIGKGHNKEMALRAAGRLCGVCRIGKRPASADKAGKSEYGTETRA
jgi:hypothetical protein